MDLLLLFAHVLMGDPVSEFELALLLSEMRVNRKDCLVYDGVRFPGASQRARDDIVQVTSGGFGAGVAIVVDEIYGRLV